MAAEKVLRGMPVPLGIDADTGLPLDGPNDDALDYLVRAGGAEAVSQETLAEKAGSEQPDLGTTREVDPKDLSQAGWAVLFGPGVDRRIKEALEPLIAHRKANVSDERLFRVFEGPTGFWPGDTASAWLARNGAGMFTVNPDDGVPYYILIVADPAEIPFEFQYSLDLYWAVGRLWFPTPEEFRQYADSVVRYETMPDPPTARQMAVFSPDNGDLATDMFCSQVALPVINGAGRTKPLGQRLKFALRPFIGASPGTAAGKDNLGNIFRGAIPGGPPALVFSGSHGVRFPSGDPRQEPSQGALICQDWQCGRTCGPNDYFNASDLPLNARVHGMIHVLFSCYGAGWPQYDNFRRLEQVPTQLASRPMIARLPQALLAHRDGGALAVLGHVDRAWAHSFHSDECAPQTQDFRDVIFGLMRGERVGEATDKFNMRWAVLSTELAETLYRMHRGTQVEPDQIKSLWIARDDARNYVVFGDPAVRLRQEDMPPLAEV